MNVFVTTSDWYNPLIPGFAYLFNRFWSPQQPVTILGYSPPDLELPSNFRFQSLGRPEQFGNEITEWSVGRRGHSFGESFPTPRWSDSLKGWLDRLLDPHFVLLQIDYFIHRPVNIPQIQTLEKYLDVDGVVKIDLSRDRTYFAHSFYAHDNGMEIIVSDQDAPYRSSLQAAIWKREYSSAMLQPGRSPWDFEERGMEEHMNDGKLILGLAGADDSPVPYLNIYSKGKVNWSKLDRLDAESRNELVGRGWMGPHWNVWRDGKRS